MTRTDLRGSLLAAADRLVREQGVGSVTVREIAREAGCSEGSVYVHFRDRADLLAHVCGSTMPTLSSAIGDLIEKVGAGTVGGNLEQIAVIALSTYGGMVPTAHALAGDPDVLTCFRAAAREADRGPHRAVRAISAYLAAEQRSGRVRPDADTTMAAGLLLGGCWYRAAMRHIFEIDVVPMDDEAFVSGLTATLMRGLEPGGSS